MTKSKETKETPLSEAQQRLVNEHLEWGMREGRFLAQSDDRARSADDAMQDAYFGLVEAARRYAPEKGAFRTYAKWWIRKAVRPRRGAHREVEITDAMADRLADEPQESQEEIRPNLDCLDEREQYVISHLYAEQPKQTKDIARELNVTSAVVTRLHKRALRKLKKSHEIAM